MGLPVPPEWFASLLVVTKRRCPPRTSEGDYDALEGGRNGRDENCAPGTSPTWMKRPHTRVNQRLLSGDLLRQLEGTQQRSRSAQRETTFQGVFARFAFMSIIFPS